MQGTPEIDRNFKIRQSQSIPGRKVEREENGGLEAALDLVSTALSSFRIRLALSAVLLSGLGVHWTH